jgi:hypothetical protein
VSGVQSAHVPVTGSLWLSPLRPAIVDLLWVTTASVLVPTIHAVGQGHLTQFTPWEWLSPP